MAETTLHPESMDDKEYIDLADSMNSATVEELKQKGPLGEFIMKLIEKGRAEKQKVMVKGMGTMTLTVKYGQETADFILKASVDQGDAPVEHAHYDLWMADYKKPWVRSLISPEASGEWLRLLPINFTDLCQELTGQNLKLNDLEKQFPNLTYNEMKSIMADETPELDDLFEYGGGNAGAWGFYMRFKSEEMHKQYLANDPALMGKLQVMASAFVPRVLEKMRALNTKKAA